MGDAGAGDFGTLVQWNLDSRMSRLSISLLSVALSCSAPADRGLARPEAVPETRFAQSDIIVGGLRVRTLDEGPRGGETVLILPGHTARIEGYDSIVPWLAEQRRVLLPDLPGKGYSDKPDRPYTFEFYEEVVIDYLDALGIERVHLVGGSLGGNLALRVAHRFPERVERVAVWGPGSAWPARPWLAAGIRTLGSYPLFWPVIRRHARYWYRDDNPDRERLLRETFAHYEEVMGPGFVRMYFDMAAASVGSSLFAIAAEIEQPVLLLRGAEDDGAGMAEGIRELERQLPHAERVEIPGARHALTSEAPEALAHAVEAFLDAPPRNPR
jgi:2-hydroxy-6-oxonona-2,4-dienedioate hydrolase